MESGALSLFSALFVCVIAISNFSLHKIEEGHVGVYFRGGALLQVCTNYGAHKYYDTALRGRYIEIFYKEFFIRN